MPEIVYCVRIIIIICMNNYYYTAGVEAHTVDGDVRVRVILLLCSVDLLAQAPLINMKQFNSKHGCHMCEQESVPRPGSNLHRNWPYLASVNCRTQASIKADAIDAASSHSSVWTLILHVLCCCLSVHMHQMGSSFNDWVACISLTDIS